MNKDIKLAKLLIALGADVSLIDPGGLTPLTSAIIALKDTNLSEDMEIIDLLVDAGADLNQRDRAGGGQTPLVWAILEGNVLLVAKLIDLGVDVNLKDRGEAPISSAVRSLESQKLFKSSTMGIVDLLIDAGADWNEKDRSGQTPFIRAACVGNMLLLEKLIALRVDVNQLNHHNQSALLLAAQEGHKKIVERLFRAGANTKSIPAKVLAHYPCLSRR